MILLGVALVTTTHAQLEVMINEPQGEFVAHERISVGFSVTNRSGRDIVLAAPDGQDWVQFRVFRGDRAVRRVAGQGTFKPIML